MRKARLPLFAWLFCFAFINMCLHAGAVINPGGALPVVGDAQNKLIPMAIKGYDGEVARVLKFDLEVMGCKIVPEGDAAHLLEGGNRNFVRGILKDAAGNFRFNQRYNGGNLRQQAHALSNDVIKAIMGHNGIAHTRILYKMKTGPRAEEFFVSDYDGHQPKALTADNVLAALPRWAPGNGEVFYTSWMNIGGVENTTVIRHKMNNGVRTVFSRFKGLNTGGAVSPQGEVAMVLSRGKNPDIWVAPAGWNFLKDKKGKQLKQMCRTREAESGPAWSPDGKWLCFATRANGRRILVKVAAAGGNMIRIPTPGAINPSGAAWSPDGKSIAFTSQAGKFFNIFVVSVNGGKAELITAGEGPSWAPNNRNLIFTRRGVNKRSLAIVDVPTKQVKILPAVRGSASQPDWQR
jgi:TolB protein|tara:strand:+ start:4264 stop:5481 length:1218 start_codon:yes stop_codon:yes gene_type:complete